MSKNRIISHLNYFFISGAIGQHWYQQKVTKTHTGAALLTDKGLELKWCILMTLFNILINAFSLNTIYRYWHKSAYWLPSTSPIAIVVMTLGWRTQTLTSTLKARITHGSLPSHIYWLIALILDYAQTQSPSHLNFIACFYWD